VIIKILTIVMGNGMIAGAVTVADGKPEGGGLCRPPLPSPPNNDHEVTVSV
jgi:hypothetical protein